MILLSRGVPADKLLLKLALAKYDASAALSDPSLDTSGHGASVEAAAYAGGAAPRVAETAAHRRRPVRPKLAPLRAAAPVGVRHDQRAAARPAARPRRLRLRGAEACRRRPPAAAQARAGERALPPVGRKVRDGACAGGPARPAQARGLAGGGELAARLRLDPAVDGAMQRVRLEQVGHIDRLPRRVQRRPGVAAADQPQVRLDGV
eukprot:CAMPEP_0202786882 /NCGR_PEP_ID=MMETSP1388-20130828/71054_1 /ASSEMBLY_ACC=CAM_ASM_000864 /TAXON_ID=37098 /ORGANISM="Isochrysis sp, Strain CCMP1244" /LENGTH=205 /DNA_ID=CAMNT_0049456455 /DNA_START=170 /DNA_END=783 /DNA_ORIENTATION=+